MRRVPHHYVSVCRAGDAARSIRAERDGIHRARMVGETMNLRGAAELPPDERRVTGAGKGRFSIRAKGK